MSDHRSNDELTARLYFTNAISSLFQLTFQEVFAEPDESIFSFDQIWRVAYKVFTTVKLWWYRILSLVFGVPLACIWGVIFACISFLQIWICVPYLKGYFIEMHCIKQVFQFTLEAFVIPMYEAAGRVFSFIRVTIVQGWKSENQHRISRRLFNVWCFYNNFRTWYLRHYMAALNLLSSAYIYRIAVAITKNVTHPGFGRYSEQMEYPLLFVPG